MLLSFSKLTSLCLSSWCLGALCIKRASAAKPQALLMLTHWTCSSLPRGTTAPQAVSSAAQTLLQCLSSLSAFAFSHQLAKSLMTENHGGTNFKISNELPSFSVYTWKLFYTFIRLGKCRQELCFLRIPPSAGVEYLLSDLEHWPELAIFVEKDATYLTCSKACVSRKANVSRDV